MVQNPLSEFARFPQDDRNTRHIKRVSPAAAVFLLCYGGIEATQAKLSWKAGQSPERAVERMFAAIRIAVPPKG